jgi:hypothetical protein
MIEKFISNLLKLGTCARLLYMCSLFIPKSLTLIEVPNHKGLNYEYTVKKG